MEFVRVGIDRRVSEEGAEEVVRWLGLAVVWFVGHDGGVSSSARVFMLGMA